MKSYITVRNAASDEFVEKKSKFIGHIFPVNTNKQAEEYINQIKADNWQASHNCWAYTLREGMLQRYSDDGEPQGTAGIPILEVLKKEEVFDALIIVTRYFGGVLLGAGGLVRAYSHAAKLSLDAGGRISMTETFIVEFKITYNLNDPFLSQATSYPMEILNTEYSDNILYTVRIRKDAFENIKNLLTELSSGTTNPIIIREEFAAI